MRISHTVAEWQQRRRSLDGRSIGFVPTMGALHNGHASLVERSRRETEIVVVSIFVNPSQFNDPKDLERYPQTLNEDLRLLESLGVDEVFIPNAREMYPEGYQLRLEPDDRFRIMEGLHRPGFLQGVMTVVLKLFNLVRPQRAYFGEKDFQQLRVITEMVREFFLEIEIVPCETIREESGLAQSSRNALLSDTARKNAAAIYQALTTGKTSEDAKQALADQGFRIDYVEEHWDRRFAAVFLDGIRLIDNVPVPK
jgi:pantoate--beta-alanine ligase